MQDKPELKIDWASHQATKYACEHWHYSKCLPVGKLVKVGAWEKDKFIGVVVFSRGANNNMLKPFGLQQEEGCELTRIALTKHEVPVSKIMALAVKFLVKSQNGLRLIVSYADPDQGHHGGIYQACNWLYTGPSGKALKVFYKGKWSHKKTVDDAGVNQTNLPKKMVIGKHRYIMPLDKEMSAKITPLAKPYPKRVKQAMTGDQPEQRRRDTDPPAPAVKSEL
jgi:hypothetical protein